MKNIVVDYAELNVNFGKNNLICHRLNIKGLNISKGRVEDRNYTLASFTRINDQDFYLS